MVYPSRYCTIYMCEQHHLKQQPHMKLMQQATKEQNKAKTKKKH